MTRGADLDQKTLKIINNKHSRHILFGLCFRKVGREEMKEKEEKQSRECFIIIAKES